MATSLTSQVFFWNSRSLRSKHPEIQSILLLVNFDILIFVEMGITKKDNFSFSGFIEIRKDKTHSKGGEILILILKNVAFWQIS